MSLKRVCCNNPGGHKPAKFGEGFNKIVCCKSVFPKNVHVKYISWENVGRKFELWKCIHGTIFNASMYQARLYRFHWICFQCELVIINFWVASLIELDDFVIFGLMSFFFSFGEKFDPIDHESAKNKSVSDFKSAKNIFLISHVDPIALKNRTFCST